MKNILLLFTSVLILSCGEVGDAAENAIDVEGSTEQQFVKLNELQTSDFIDLENFDSSFESRALIGTVTPVETNLFLDNNPNVVKSIALTQEQSNKLFGFGKKPEKFKNEELPMVYKNRTFIKNLSSLTYEIQEIPGHIVKYDSAKDDYRIITLKRLIKGNNYPEMKIIEDGVLYSSKINSEANFNASFLIGGLGVDNKSIMELIIQDVMLSIVSDTSILVENIKEIAKNLSDRDRKKCFYVKGTTLTLVNNKKYKEQKFEAKVNNTYVTAEGKIFASNEKFSRERLVSLDLVSLDDLLGVN